MIHRDDQPRLIHSPAKPSGCATHATFQLSVQRRLAGIQSQNITSPPSKDEFDAAMAPTYPPPQEKEEEATSLIDLPNELQDMIYALCAPEEVHIDVKAVLKGDGDEYEDAIINSYGSNYSAIVGLYRTCRKTRERVVQETAKHITFVLNWRKTPNFKPIICPGKIPSYGILPEELLAASSNVRILIPMSFTDWWNR